MAIKPSTRRDCSKKISFCLTKYIICAIYVRMIKHGRESLVKISDGKFVSKEPLPGRSISQKREWLARQQKAADTIKKLHEIGNNVYGVPHIKSVDATHFRVFEERVSGVPLTPLLFRNLDDKTRARVIDALAEFYADIHSIDVIPNPIEYKMEYGLSVMCLDDFIDADMGRYFPKSDVKFVEKMYRNIMNITYETRLVWVHGDLFEDNVLYDYKTQRFNVIDFTDAGTGFLHYDMLRSYSADLGVANVVRTEYLKHRNVHDLPNDFTDDARWAKISRFHDAVDVLEKMDEELADFQYLNTDERKRTLARVKRQIAALHKFDREI